MPRLTELDRRTPSELLRGRKPRVQTWWGAPLDHPANYLDHRDNLGGKLCAALGLDAVNPDSVGEIFYISQPEGDPSCKQGPNGDALGVMKKAYLSSSVLTSLVRMTSHTQASTAQRRQRTTSQSVYLQRFNRELRGQPPLHGDALRLSTFEMAGRRYVRELAKSQTVHRREVHQGLTPNTLKARDSLDRPNPGATAARVARLSDELLKQIVFDRGSARSLEFRGQVAVDALADDFDTVEHLADIAERHDEAALKAELPGILELLSVKPMSFVGSYIDWLDEHDFENLQTKSWWQIILFVISAEFQLIGVDDVLSRLRDNLELIDDQLLELLGQSLGSLMNFADGYYSALARELRIQLDVLRGFQSDGANSWRKRKPQIERMKRTIRFRYVLPKEGVSHEPWTLRPTRDRFGTEIWVAQSRFGADATVSSIGSGRSRP